MKNMTKTMWAMALGLAMTQAALAQPVAPPGGDSEQPPALGEPTPPPPPPPPAVPPQPPQPPQVQEEPMLTGPADRPDGTAIGIGFGYTLPTSIQTPNTVSGRLRFAGGLTLEPRVVLANSTTTEETDTTEVSTSTTTLALASIVRFPLVKRGKYELLLLGAAGVGIDSTDPDGADNNTTTTTFAVQWGAAVDWWISPHWNVSFNATNPLFSLASTSQENPAPAGDDSTTTTSFGAVWNPTVSVMIHLYH